MPAICAWCLDALAPHINRLPYSTDKPCLNGVDDLFEWQACSATDCTFPDMADPPSHDGKCAGNPGITGVVALEFGCPPVSVGGWHTEHGAMVVGMPEAAIDEDDGSVFRQDDVGSAGIASVIDAVAETAGKQCLAHQHFWSGVFCPDMRHDAVASFGCEGVCHGVSILTQLSA